MFDLTVKNDSRTAFAESYLVGDCVTLRNIPCIEDGEYKVIKRVPPRPDGTITLTLMRADTGAVFND